MVETKQGEIQALLQQEEFVIDRTSVETWLEWLEFRPLANLSKELAWLKQLRPGTFRSRGNEDAEWINDPNASLPCGLKVFRLDNEPEQVQNLTKRTSKLMFERDFFDALYKRVTSLLEQRKRIIMSGNAGIGKSWFQVYFLYRLLNAGENQLFRFVVRQFQTEFYLMDILTCRGWQITGPPEATRELLNALKQTLYLYEPGRMVDQPPILTSAPSLSTLSPRPARIKQYKKQSGPEFLYMPVWGLHELTAIAKMELRNPRDTKTNFESFGGIIRYTLGDSSVIKQATADLKIRCRSVTKEFFRSITANIDDSANADQQYNISGFFACYVDIPRDGDDAFATWSLGMTSEYACKKIREKFNKDGPATRLNTLASHLALESRDITGIDLESSVVQMLSSGPRTVKWYYCPVKEGVPSPSHELSHTERAIWRESDINTAALNYPINRIFGLVDCFILINSAWCAFRITWQEAQPFRLRTLLDIREKLGVGVLETVNIYFVNPNSWRPVQETPQTRLPF